MRVSSAGAQHSRSNPLHHFVIFNGIFRITVRSCVMIDELVYQFLADLEGMSSFL